MAGARRFEDLLAWQLASELSAALSTQTDRGRASKDRIFCEQISRSADSGPANIAEGFGRFAPREFARFLRIARGSLLETRSHILKGISKGYFTEDEGKSLLHLQSRATGAVTSLMRYLDSCKGKSPTGWDHPREKREAGPGADG